jgi:hypothetical protein
MAKLRTNPVCRTMFYIPSYRTSAKVVSLCLCAGQAQCRVTLSLFSRSFATTLFRLHPRSLGDQTEVSELASLSYISPSTFEALEALEAPLVKTHRRITLTISKQRLVPGLSECSSHSSSQPSLALVPPHFLLTLPPLPPLPTLSQGTTGTSHATTLSTVSAPQSQLYSRAAHLSWEMSGR